MKINKLLLVSVAMLLGLSACTKGPKKDNSSDQPSSGGNESPSESESIPEPPEPEKPFFYFDEGTATGFPQEALDEFLEYYEADFEVIAPDIDQDWKYSAEVNDNCIPLLFMSTSDENSPTPESPDPTGNAYEDAYKAVLEEEGIVVTDEYYDSIGYTVYNEDGVLLYNFFSWNGKFVLDVYCPQEISNVISQNILNYFFTNAFFMEDVEIPLPDSNEDWEYEVYFGDGSGSYLDISTVDDFAPNSDNPDPTGDAIEDHYLETLEDAGWTVDDTYYTSSGYYATCDDVPFELGFYSWSGRFYLEIMYNVVLFPSDVLQIFLAEIGADEDVFVPIPESEDVWYWEYNFDYQGFTIYTDDEGTPGENAIEDQYVALLNGDDWSIDDSEYETVGYVATLGNVQITFFSYDGEFDMLVALFEEPEEPEEPEDPQNPGE